jgi:hypothetical protein
MKKKKPVDKYYLGIDPGKSGGIAVLTSLGNLIALDKMPSTETDLWQWFVRPFGSRSFALVEWIHPAIQGIGKSPMSKLYGNYMQLRMALIATEIPFEHVMPRKWQQSLGISTRKKTETTVQWKNRLKSKAQELFPSEKITLATCDALLIAEYSRRKDQGKL